MEEVSSNHFERIFIMKKVFSSALALVLMLTTLFGFSTSAQAATGTTWEDPIVVTDGSTTPITFTEYDFQAYLMFTAPETKMYEFTMSNCPTGKDDESFLFICEYAPKVEDSNIITSCINEGSICKAAVTLTAGKTYMIDASSFFDGPDRVLYFTVGAHTHKIVKESQKGTTKQAGMNFVYCAYCDEEVPGYAMEYYPQIGKITLSATSYTYNGKNRKPSVTVKNVWDDKIKSSEYTVTYPKNCKNVGKYTVTIKFKNHYSGTVKKTYEIKPKGTSVSKVTAGKKKFTVKWKKQTSQTTGYQIQYSTDKNFKKNNKTVTVSKNKTTSKTVSKLSGKKKYYVRVRTYKTVKVNGKNTKIYSAWSKTKTVTTKK